jgi:hypothetical protein
VDDVPPVFIAHIQQIRHTNKDNIFHVYIYVECECVCVSKCVSNLNSTSFIVHFSTITFATFLFIYFLLCFWEKMEKTVLPTQKREARIY